MLQLDDTGNILAAASGLIMETVEGLVLELDKDFQL